jgi:hypothetical protein
MGPNCFGFTELSLPDTKLVTTNFDLLSQKREREDKNNLTCVSQLLNA